MYEITFKWHNGANSNQFYTLVIFNRLHIDPWWFEVSVFRQTFEVNY